jgi:colicin import membrane protein
MFNPNKRDDNKDSFKAGVLAIAVHAGLLVALLFSVNWKAAHPVTDVTEVELWDKLPAPSKTAIKEPKPEVKPPEIKPIVEEKPEPKPEPIVEKPKEEPKLEPKPEEPKVDIELEKKKKELEEKQAKKEEEKLKKEKELAEKIEEKKKLAALQAATREDELKADKAAKKKEDDRLKKLQQEMLNNENAEGDKQAKAASSAANASIIGEYKDRIRRRILGNVNNSLCGEGNPEVRFQISIVLVTGQLSGSPKLIKPSGNDACDAAVERAIIASEPFQLPEDPSIRNEFRNLNLKFRPND